MTAKPQREPQERAHFAGCLRKWRDDRGMLLKQAATDFGVTEATWSRWEKQERFPSPANLRLLAQFIGVPICCFFYPEPGTCPNCLGSHPTVRHPGLTSLSKRAACFRLRIGI